MAMQPAEIEAFIKAALPDAEVIIQDLAGDGDHYAASVVSEAFRGKSRVQQHQLVYAALLAAAQAASIPARRLGRSGGGDLVLPDGGSISLATLRDAHERFLPTLMSQAGE